MKKARKVLKVALVSLASLVGVLVLLALCVLEWPSILINRHTLGWAEGYLNHKPEGPHLHWDQVQVKTAHRGLLGNQVALHFDNLCFKDPRYGHGCFKIFHAAFAYGMSHVMPQLTELGPMTAQADEIDLQVPPEAAVTHTTASAPPPSKSATRLIQHARLEPIDVSVKHWTLALPNLGASGSYELRLEQGRPDAQGVTLHSSLKAVAQSHAAGGAVDTHAHVTLDASNSSGLVSGPWRARIDLGALSPKLKAKLSTRAALAQAREDHVDFKIDNLYTSPLGKVEATAAGWAIAGKEVKGELHGKMEPTRAQRQEPLSLLSLIQMNRVYLKNCTFDWKNAESDNQDGKFVSSCDFDTRVVHLRLGQAAKPPVKLWRSLGLKADAEVTLPGPKHSTSPVSARLTLTPHSALSAALRLAGKVRANLDIVPAELPAPKKFQTRIDVRAEVPRFRSLVNAFSDTPIAIPAPLRVLEGPTEMSVKGTLDLKQASALAVHWSTRLNHAPDHLDAEGGGTIEIDPLQVIFDRPSGIPGVDAKLDIELSRVHLTAPKLGFSAPPTQVLPDPRIHPSVPTPSGALTQHTQHGELSHFRYLVRVKTPPSHPIEIASQFMEKPVAIGLDLRLRPGVPWAGWAEINGNREPVGVPSSQMAGQAAGSRTGPKLPFGFSELISSLITGAPLEGLTAPTRVGPSEALPPQEEPRIGSVLELRRRY